MGRSERARTSIYAGAEEQPNLTAASPGDTWPPEWRTQTAKDPRRSVSHRKSGVEKPRRQPVPVQESVQNKPDTWPRHAVSRQKTHTRGLRSRQAGSAHPDVHLQHPESGTRGLPRRQPADESFPGVAQPPSRLRAPGSIITSPRVTDSGAATPSTGKRITPGGCAAAKPAPRTRTNIYATPSQRLGGYYVIRTASRNTKQREA